MCPIALSEFEDLRRRLVSHVRAPYRIMDFPKPELGDSLRLVLGSELTVHDISAGWSLERMVISNSQRLTLAELCENLISDNSDRLFLLQADPGDGKTSYRRQLMLNLAIQGAVPVDWVTVRDHQPDQIDDIRVLSDGRPVVVTGDVDSGLEDLYFSRLAQWTRPGQLRCPILLAVRPLDLCKFKHAGVMGANVLTFASVERDMALNLVALLVRALRDLTERRVSSIRYPNLERFLAQPDPAATLIDNPSIGPSPKLLYALLFATYGEDFRRRLGTELKQIQDEAVREAYSTICLATAVRPSGIESGLVVKLVSKLIQKPLTGVSEFIEGNLWCLGTEGGKDCYRARHQFIAETVVAEVPLVPEELGKMVNGLFECLAPEDLNETAFLIQFLLGYAKWRSIISEQIHAPLQGKMGRPIREAIKKYIVFVSRTRTAVERSERWGLAGQWGSLFYHLLPEKRGKADEELLFKEATLWLGVAEKKYPPELQPQVEYLKAKMLFLENPDEARVQQEVLDKFMRLDRDYSAVLGVDFYVDAEKLVKLKQSARIPATFASFAVRVYETLLAYLPGTEWVVENYGGLRTKLYHYLQPTDLLAAFEEGWRVSKLHDVPRPEIGLDLVYVLMEKHGQVGIIEHEARERAAAVLLKILAHYPGWGEACYWLARLAAADPELRGKSREQAGLGISAQNELNRALSLHSLGILEKAEGRSEEAADAFVKACESYEKGITNASFQIYGSHHWKEACEILKKLGRQEARNALEKYREAEASFSTRRMK